MAIGDIIVRIVADARNLISGVDRASRKLSWFSRRAMSLSSVVRGGFMAGMSGASLQWIQRVTEEIDQLGDDAAAIGTSVRQLSLWSSAARIAGIQTDSFVRSLVMMNRNISIATRGGRNVFARWGLDAKKLAELDLAGKLREISDAVSTLSSDEDRLAATMEIFGRNGRIMLELLAEGRTRLDEFARAAREAGAGIDEADVEQIDRLGKMLRTSAERWKSLGRRAVSVVSSVAAGIQEGFAQTVGEWMAWREGVDIGLTSVVGNVVREVRSEFLDVAARRRRMSRIGESARTVAPVPSIPVATEPAPPAPVTPEQREMLRLLREISDSSRRTAAVISEAVEDEP